ncbi:response regulator transcription factor [Actinacidiphila oryziradicis]|jgi:DNA-binding NarL/FixJ family response regulator|uniref:response regulator n=1 Tax=Actinacidiphila oryziradicis TaxID=2571141 RepID=UPI001FE5DC13|nr:response regulator transcription factor [Actinacidiphila oryziradicis]MCW2872370.1 DNA-binding response regulator, LuxR family [Actinacidiphila oryziradicis]
MTGRTRPEGEELTRVLVVDDQFLIRAGLVALLRAAPDIEVVGEAADGAEAVERAATTRPDVILMDIRMPGMSGVSATERILEQARDRQPLPLPRVLVLTTFDLDEYVYAALRAGASGFLLKDAGPERLLAAVAAVAGGDMLFAPSVTRRLIEAYTRGVESSADTPADLDALTAREVEVLRLIARGLSNTEIADRLFISEATVKTHLNRTMTKLDLGSRAQAVVLAYESGLVTPRAGGA